MEILIGIVASLITQLIKKIAGKYDREFTALAIYGMIFVAAAIWSALESVPTLAGYMQSIVSIFTASVATYEVVIKRLGNFLPPPPTSPSLSDGQTGAGTPSA